MIEGDNNYVINTKHSFTLFKVLTVLFFYFKKGYVIRFVRNTGIYLPVLPGDSSRTMFVAQLSSRMRQSGRKVLQRNAPIMVPSFKLS